MNQRDKWMLATGGIQAVMAGMRRATTGAKRQTITAPLGTCGRARLAAVLVLVFVLPSCAVHDANAGAEVTIGDRRTNPWPTPLLAPPNALPRIQAIHLSSDSVPRGQNWSGQIATSTNVASVEVRTNLFSFSAPRKSFGQFGFSVHVLELPTIFIRRYSLRIIARNTAGVESEQDIPFRLR